jgi:hypothetical protein
VPPFGGRQAEHVLVVSRAQWNLAQSDHQAFCEQLLHQAATAGADRQTHRDFLRSSGGPGEQQVGDVGARDQQDQPEGPQDHGREAQNVAPGLGQRQRRRRCDVQRRGTARLLPIYLAGDLRELRDLGDGA